MPEAYVEKYLDTKVVVRRTEKAKSRTEAFLARQLSVPASDVAIEGNGIALSDEAYEHLLETPLNDRSFVATGGPARAAYEVLEMAYNDVMSGSVQAGGASTVGIMRRGFNSAVKMAGGSATATLKAIADSGILKVAGGLGIGATAAIGIWLARLGGKQVKQARARQDQEQLWNGARSLFLGAESLAAGLAITASIASGPVAAAAGAVAATVAAPFAVVHGVIDVAQGVEHVKEGVTVKDGLRTLEGISEIGMGIGWLAAAFFPVPAVVAGSAICLATKMGVALAKSRRTKKASQAEQELAKQEETVYCQQMATTATPCPMSAAGAYTGMP